MNKSSMAKEGTQLFVSIAINNYNYSQFLRECIDSALKQTYQQGEVIVVDDGSTDDSISIIESYGNRIISVLKENGGQGSAYNEGYAKAQGDIIIFLDSDDVLFPDTVTKVVEAWLPDTAKVHFRLAMINDEGQEIGGLMSNFLHSGDVRKIIEKFGCYGSPPGSGNAFSKSALEKCFPMPEPEWRIAADTYPIMLAPFFGQVVTLNGIAGLYRIHKKQNHKSKFVLNNNPSDPGVSVFRSYRSRQLIFKALVHFGLTETQGFKFEAPANIKMRLISFRVSPLTHPVENETSLKILHDGFMAVLNWTDFPLKNRFLYMLWIIGVLFLPQSLAEEIILWAINSEYRPRWFKNIILTL